MKTRELEKRIECAARNAQNNPGMSLVIAMSLVHYGTAEKALVAKQAFAFGALEIVQELATEIEMLKQENEQLRRTIETLS